MNNIESITEFYENMPMHINILRDSGMGHFNVFQRQFPTVTASYVRRDFYKIALIIGTGILRYANKEVLIEKPALYFSNPSIPHSWQAISEKQDGWFCLFSNEFIQSFGQRIIIKDYPMFRLEGDPVIFLNDTALENISYIFNKMLKEKESDYIYKYDKQRSYLQLLIHEALGQYPNIEFGDKRINAAHRITYQFLELLGKQFPLESPSSPLKLKTAKKYAQRLSIHVNHMNRSVKEVTGRSPSNHIIMRIAEEAKSLLQNTDWSISEIAYTLGFEYTSHFTAFLKKHAGLTPKEIRQTRQIV